jgi:hypothetical protein
MNLRRKTVVSCAPLVLAVLCSAPASAVATAPAPRLVIGAVALPTHFSEADDAACEAFEVEEPEPPPCDDYQVRVTNLGSGTATGPIVVSDRLPEGVSVRGVHFYWAVDPLNQKRGEEEGLGGAAGRKLRSETYCKTEVAPVRETCEFPTGEVFGRPAELRADYRLQMDVYVTLAAGAESAANEASVSENGTVVASTEGEDDVDSTAAGFGVGAFGFPVVSADGLADTQAGDHPFGLSTTVYPDTAMRLTPASESNGPHGEEPAPTAVGELRDVVIDLPPGLIGSAVAAPKCTFAQLQSFSGSCPADTIVGKIVSEPLVTGAVNSPVYNMVPKRGAVAEFGFQDLLYHTHTIVASVAPTPSGYVARAVAREIPQIAFTDVVNWFYGVPAERNGGGATPAAMFTMPSDCSGEPLVTRLYMDSWLDPARFTAEGQPLDLQEGAWATAVSEAPPVTGCDQLRFQPSAFTFAPEAAHSQADEPSGYESVLKVPQTEAPSTLATPPLKSTVVTLPAGVAISPSAANGLVGCTEAELGMRDGVPTPGAGGCPEASKVGTVEVQTPLLEERVSEGSVYVAQPLCGGAGQPACSEQAAEEGGVFGIYLEVSSRERGIHIKLKGKVEVGGNGSYSREHGLAAGQIRTSFLETPQFPISELKFNFNGGPRAPLANPQSCGTFTTDASLEPWSAPQSGPAATENPSFDISANCAGGFAPSFESDMLNPQAGAFSAFTTTFGRADGEQDLSGVEVTPPEGLVGRIAGITPCAEAEANAGTCPGSSRVGTATAAAGSGPDPFYQSGPVYLTGPYEGAPFGLSVAIPAVAGPYNLGTIVTRARILIDPHTSQVTVVSNPLPQMVDGVPLRLQKVNVTVGEDDDFTLNPTSCEEKHVAGTVTSTSGTPAAVSTRFQAGNCASLAFSPSVTVTTTGHASKADGVGVAFRIAYPNGSLGNEANFNYTRFTIPKQLPSRLTTIQQACVAATFEANPAACPEHSVIGTATVHTQVLPVPLSGPVYFVSYGNAKFPDVVMVLQGDNVKIDLTGETFIHDGVTTATFPNTPDVPFENIEVALPTGPYSEFGSNLPHESYDFCGQKLTMPTIFKASNGREINQNSPVTITGCPTTLSIAGHTLKGKTITLTVYAPAAGKLRITAKGLGPVSKNAAGQELLTVTLHTKDKHSFKTRLTITYTPAHGTKQTTRLALKAP